MKKQNKNKAMEIGGLVVVAALALIISFLVLRKPKVTYKYYVNNMESNFPIGTYVNYTCDNRVTLEYDSESREYKTSEIKRDTTCNIYLESPASLYVYALANNETTSNEFLVDNRENARYVGENAKNYVYFNCSDYTNKDTCEVWKIIGSFKDLDDDGNYFYSLKIIDSKPLELQDINGSKVITKLAWHHNHEDGSNNFSNSDIYKLLNEAYYNGSGNINYNGLNKNYTFDFSNVGLKNDKTRLAIMDSRWRYSQLTDINLNVDAWFNNEYADAYYNGKIGLINASDYTYSFGSACRDLKISKFYNCTSKSWMKNTSGLWTINPQEDMGNTVYRISHDGAVNAVWPTSEYEIYPTLYLNSDVKIIAGDGSSSNPYQLDI